MTDVNRVWWLGLLASFAITAGFTGYVAKQTAEPPRYGLVTQH